MILNKCIFNYSINSTMTKHLSLVWLGKMHNLYHWHIFDQPANNRALRSLVVKAVQSSFLLSKKHISNDCKEWSPVDCSDPVVVGPQPSPSGLQQVEYTRTRFAWGKALLSAPCSALLSSVTNTAGPFLSLAWEGPVTQYGLQKFQTLKDDLFLLRSSDDDAERQSTSNTVGEEQEHPPSLTVHVPRGVHEAQFPTVF